MSGGAPEPPSPPLAEEEHFEIVLSLNEEDLVLFEREYVPRRGGCLIPLLLVAGLVAVGAATAMLIPTFVGPFGLVVRWTDQLVLGACTAVLIGVALAYVGQPIGKALGWRDTALDTNGWLLVTTVDGLWLQCAASARMQPWAGLKEMIVSEGAIYLGLERREAMMLPRRVFGDRNDFYTFGSVVAKYAGI